MINYVIGDIKNIANQKVFAIEMVLIKMENQNIHTMTLLMIYSIKNTNKFQTYI